MESPSISQILLDMIRIDFVVQFSHKGLWSITLRNGTFVKSMRQKIPFDCVAIKCFFRSVILAVHTQCELEVTSDQWPTI